MVCGEPVENSKVMGSSSILPKSAQEATVAPKMGIRLDSATSAKSAASATKDDTAQVSVVRQDANNPPANYYSYHYPGDLSFSQSNDGRGHRSTGARADQGSVAYYMTGPYHTSTRYNQTPVTHGVEPVPCPSLDRNSHGNTSNGSNTANGATVKSTSSPSLSKRPNGIKPSQLYDFLDTKSSSVSSNSRQSGASSSFSHSKLNKAGSYHQTDGYSNARCPSGNYQPLSYQRHSLYGNYGAMGYRSDVRTRNVNDCKLRPSRKSEFESSSELTCGPRGRTEKLLDSSEKGPLTLGIRKDRYNLADFETDYEAAKFYVIKSYSEDDVHKSIMYDVWSSTVHGNKKLDAAFHGAKSMANETGKKCPVFLFFSVNGSGQFVGVAEMVGKVDFNKTMDFWQMDKWSGFFPLRWHIVKDVPNAQLRHIILENNDNKPVTYTRDTQEIGMKQGLEMLKIFKSYSSKTSLLDDLDFYESRAKAPEKRQSSNPSAHNHTDVFANKDLPKQMHAKRGEANSVSAIVNLTNNLSLNNRARRSVV